MRIGVKLEGIASRPMSDSNESAGAESGRIIRHSLAERMFHWVTAVCMFVLLGTALLPIFGINFNWLTPHWIAGIVLTMAVLMHAIRAFTSLQWRDMSLGFGEMFDSVRAELSIVRGTHVNRIRIAKYSVAQKLYHLGMSIVVLVAIGTGLVMMIGIDTPFWDRGAVSISERTRGVVFVAHGVATLLSISMIIIHVYFALRPEKMYFTRSMIRGWITRIEYEKHHDTDLWRGEEG